MKLTSKIVIYLSFSILIIVIPASILIWNHQRQILFEQAKIQAETLFEMIVITRQWVADNDERVEPVPAVVTKELSQYARNMSNIRFHITSTELVNPENAPDDFEKIALKQFATGAEAYSEIGYIDDLGKVYRYMAPLKINASCLSCHQYQGYNVGDLRGGISVTIPLGFVEQAILHNNKLFYAFAFIMFVGIVFVVSVLINNMILKHIKNLKAAADDVMHKKYDRKTAISTNDELAELSKVFDSMSERIEKSEDILRSRLKDSVSKYVSLVEELEEKNTELQRVSQFKTDILDSVAHEIRTPMTKILSYSEMILDPELSKDEDIVGQAGKIIKRNLLLLRNLFNQMITMNRLDHSQFEYHHFSINLSSFLSEIVEYFNKEITEKRLKVNTILLDNVFVNVDPQAFTYVFNNLISNAIKYNVVEGELEIAMEVVEKEIHVSVYDTGVGIRKEDTDHIFSRFFRGENVKKTHQGTGLGLSIAHRIVVDHGGRIEVFSKLGSFSKFTVIVRMNDKTSD